MISAEYMLNVPKVNTSVVTNAGESPDIIMACASMRSKAMGRGMSVPIKESRLRLARFTGTPINLSKLQRWLAKAPNTPANSIKGTVRAKI